ncbi:hypothetical protein JX265_009116 [Neoarthrinium moseri]|uniref:CBS domain-containing protein n=1 Tax=Neoarthrinium moseri TaxID=1658444 RepID=A0A9P9WGN0_9PEZI|nr:hypothetical protein JX266_013772 [Neoarthrinium moseri]KAI1862402.1 hypothetical protein JX265_009116 [Neoarthrinium moseri]
MDSSKGHASSAADSTKDVSVSPPAQPSRSNSSSSIHRAGSHGHVASHRQSFAENLRGLPPSPRAQRHPSFTQAAIQDLLNHPPATRPFNPRFTGRDWRDVSVGELVSQDDVKWVDLDTSVEDATMALLKNGTSNVVLVRETSTESTAISTFDHNDLNAYLLVVVGLAHPPEDLVALYDSLAKKAQAHESIPLRDIQPICRKETLVTLQGDEALAKATEVFGSGIHRVLVANPAGDAIGVLSQLRLMEFFYNEGVNFRVIDDLYPRLMRDLGIGSQQIIAINADSPLADALSLMNDEGLSSIAVIDNSRNVVGNISTVDVRLLTSATSLPLLQNTCMHFISVILNERGVEKGKDSFPVFYVNPYSTLAHTARCNEKSPNVGGGVSITFTFSTKYSASRAHGFGTQLNFQFTVVFDNRNSFPISAGVLDGRLPACILLIPVSNELVEGKAQAAPSAHPWMRHALVLT